MEDVGLKPQQQQQQQATNVLLCLAESACQQNKQHLYLQQHEVLGCVAFKFVKIISEIIEKWRDISTVNRLK